MWGTFVHMYTKHEVSMFNPVPGGGVQVTKPMPMMMPPMPTLMADKA